MTLSLSHVYATASCLAFLAFLTTARAQADPCVSTQNISNVKRSRDYVYDGNVELPLCDYGVIDENLWYTFGAKIPEVDIVDELHCGTDSPIYIPKTTGNNYHDDAKNGSSEVTAPICANYGVTGCDWSNNIAVRWCESSSTFVYKLKNPPGCSVAYCAGEGLPCPPDHRWIEQQGQCMNEPPIMTSLPILLGPEIVDRQEFTDKNGRPLTAERFAFRCKVGYTKQNVDDGARFKIQVLFNSVPADEIVIPVVDSVHPEAEIIETLLRDRLAKSISCSVRSYWDGDESSLSDALESNSTYVGIQVPAVTYLVESNRPIEIDYYSTVPITCWHCIEHQDYAHKCADSCEYLFKTRNTPYCTLIIGNTNPTASVEVRVESYANIRPADAYIISFDRLTPYAYFEGTELWRNYTLPDVTVRVNEADPQECSSVTDPHLKTVNYGSYDNQLLGDFYLLNTASGYLQIQTRHEICWEGSHPTCNCGIIIREGNTMLGLDNCRTSKGGTVSNTPQIIEYLRSDPKDGSSVYRDEAGTTFIFAMASGLLVEAKPYFDRFYSFYLNIPGKYRGQTTGMCNWQPGQKPEEFRVAQGTSMFDNKNPECFDHADNPPAALADCVRGGGSTFNIAPVGADTKFAPKQTPFKCIKPTRRKRSTSSGYAPTAVVSEDESDNTIDIDDAFHSQDYDPDSGKNVTVSWPTPTGKTEEEVEAYCVEQLHKSPAYEQCAGKFNETELVKSCKADIQLLDRYVALESYAALMEKECVDKAIAESNVTSPEEVANDESIAAITKNICPNLCRGNGTCTNGKCVCFEGFAGGDCSVRTNSPPVINGLFRSQLCDLQSRACAKTTVYVSNVYNSTELSCRFESFSVIDGTESGVFTVAGVLNSAFEVICPTPDNFAADSGRRRSSGYYLVMT